MSIRNVTIFPCFWCIAKLSIFLFLLSFWGTIGFVWWAQVYGFTARSKPSRVETAIVTTYKKYSIPKANFWRVNPLTPMPHRLSRARDTFAKQCATCHGMDGSGHTLINHGLYPSAPDLREKATQLRTDGELFFVIKEGVRFSGMPGWGGDDEATWELVTFIRHLPSLGQNELEWMRASPVRECGCAK